MKAIKYFALILVTQFSLAATTHETEFDLETPLPVIENNQDLYIEFIDENHNDIDDREELYLPENDPIIHDGVFEDDDEWYELE